MPNWRGARPKGHLPPETKPTVAARYSSGQPVRIREIAEPHGIPSRFLVQILLQFVWQCAGVILLRRYRHDIAKPFRMWLYPLPAIVSLVMWLYIFATAPLAGILFSAAFLVAALAAYAVFQRSKV